MRRLFLSLLKSSHLQNQNGQVAIFVALVFQVLFVFFAMLVNVGLLVHHKINLQNSADLAAYYGAMKQAEMLNVMAHTNFQMRQSWKLLVWRYRTIGGYGHKWMEGTNGSLAGPRIYPFEWNGINGNPGQFFNNRIGENSDGAQDPRWYNLPIFCITHGGLEGWPNENLCNINQGTLNGAAVSIVNPTPPAVTGGLNGSAVSASVASAIQTANQLGKEKCILTRHANYSFLASFVASYQFDVAARKALFIKMWEALQNSSGSKNTFTDLNGEDVATGAIETLKRNLTAPNYEYIQSTNNRTVQTFNGLSDPNCRFESAFEENVIQPDFFYLSSVCSSGGGQANSYLAEHLSKPPDACGGAIPPYAQRSCELAQYVYQTSPPIIRMSLGYSRNPRCVPYYGVTVESQPKIPFLPMGTVKLKAESYAQAFGGSMGPWWSKEYGQMQANSLTESIGPQKDPRGLGGQITLNQRKGANFAKYPGDQYGMASNSQLAFYAYQFLNVMAPANNRLSLNDWNSMGGNSGADYLSSKAALREMELSVVAPNLYDAAYYSIEPNFYNVYFTKLIKRFGKKIFVGNLGEVYNRPDYGSEFNASTEEFSDFSVKDQLKAAENLFSKPLPGFGSVRQRMKGSLDTQAQVLTSWNTREIGKFEEAGDIGSKLWRENFGQCRGVDGAVDNDYKLTQPTAGNCINGGRSGFSVRLSSKKYFTEDLSSKIQNPIPANW